MRGNNTKWLKYLTNSGVYTRIKLTRLTRVLMCDRSKEIREYKEHKELGKNWVVGNSLSV